MQTLQKIAQQQASTTAGVRAHLWIKLELRNVAQLQRLLLEIGYPPLDHVEAHILRDGVAVEYYVRAAP